MTSPDHYRFEFHPGEKASAQTLLSHALNQPMVSIDLPVNMPRHINYARVKTTYLSSRTKSGRWSKGETTHIFKNSMYWEVACSWMSAASEANDCRWISRQG